MEIRLESSKAENNDSFTLEIRELTVLGNKLYLSTYTDDAGVYSFLKILRRLGVEFEIENPQDHQEFNSDLTLTINAPLAFHGEVLTVVL